MLGLRLNRWAGTATIPMSATNLADMNLSSANIDERLNWHAAAGTTGQIFHLYGNDPRTPASDAAYTALTTPPLNNYIITERLQD
jgi:hypothetical protein